jgi:hypothetical protein
MKVLQWILITLGVLVTLLIAICIGGYFYVVSGPDLVVTAKDLEVGAPWSATERAGFVSACVKKSGATHPDTAPKVCECVAKETEAKTSRAVRFIVAATFDGDWRKVAKVVVETAKVAASTGATSTDDGRAIAESLKANCGMAP